MIDVALHDMKDRGLIDWTDGLINSISLVTALKYSKDDADPHRDAPPKRSSNGEMEMKNVINFWLAVDPVTPEDGAAMRLYPNTTHTPFRGECNMDNMGLRDMLKKKGGAGLALDTAPAGTLLAFEALTYHMSLPNTSARRRIAISALVSPSSGFKLDVNLLK